MRKAGCRRSAAAPPCTTLEPHWPPGAGRHKSPGCPTLVVTGRTPATAAATRLAQAIHVRRTDRRPVSDEPLSAAAVNADGRPRRGRAARVHPGQVQDLTVAACWAATVQADDPRIGE
jgi:hypothetical protein